jgi:hypothetical protein
MGRYSKEQLDRLNADMEFHRRVSSDKELDRLVSTPPETADERFAEIGLALGATACIGSAELPKLAIGGLLLLSAVESPLIASGDNVSALDVDVALHLLTLGVKGIEACGRIADVELEAAGLCESLGLDRAETAAGIVELISMSFRAFNRIPATSGKSRKFDLAWATSMAARVTAASGIDSERVMWQMPLSMACYYILSDHERQGGIVDHGRCRGDEAMDRLHYLMDERLRELNNGAA